MSAININSSTSSIPEVQLLKVVRDKAGFISHTVEMPPLARRRFGISWPPWTASSDGDNPFSRLSGPCRDSLFEIAVLFHEVDLAIVNEIQSDRDLYGNSLARPSRGTRTQSRFDEISSHVGEFHVKVLGHRPSQGHRTLYDRDNIEIDLLVDTNYNDVWKLAAEALLVSQGVERTGVTYNVTKNRARLILSLRSKIMDLIEPIEDELLEQKLGYLLSAMKSRLRSLNGFEAVYDREVGTRGQFKDEPPYKSPSKRSGKGHSASGAYQQNQQNRNATLTTVVFATSLLAFIPIVFAWHRAPDVRGSAQDVDFWLLLQNSIMQLLGLFTAIFPMYRQAKSHAWIWAQAFTAVGTACSVASIPLYLYAPTMWSALLSFFGSAAQAGMALLLALMADVVTMPLKED